MCSTNPGRDFEPCWDETCPKCPAILNKENLVLSNCVAEAEKSAAAAADAPSAEQAADVAKEEDRKRPASESPCETPMRKVPRRRLTPLFLGEGTICIESSARKTHSPTAGESLPSSSSSSLSQDSATSSIDSQQTTLGPSPPTPGTDSYRWYTEATRWCHSVVLNSVIVTKKKPRYTAILDMTVPLNASKSKKIVMGIDLDRGLLPFVSIENSQGHGVTLTFQEFEQLCCLTWRCSVAEHMENPSYTVRTKYSAFHEYRCAIAEGKPVVQISPLHGEKGGYVYLGQNTWETLWKRARMFYAYMADIEARMAHLPKMMCTLLTHFLERCHDVKTLQSKIDKIGEIFDDWVFGDDITYNFVAFGEERDFKMPCYHNMRAAYEIVHLYPQRLAAMVHHLQAKPDLAKEMQEYFPKSLIPKP
ncbi:uncharacterized protein LOC127749183 [Frankliniella occidentalis]|uniref:Uncharacterized protein LOC127749183 n=1 Tax=Frankliniella occidentalis TaxID=133901 RepID=A0A9C6TY14_FRAOC|nr:uncharacterized protein LOC127749183 [Frankliniella occidentalis]